MSTEQKSRRAVLQAGIAGVAGLAVGALGGSLLSPRQVQPGTTITQAITQTVGVQKPPPTTETIHVAATVDVYKWDTIQQDMPIQFMKAWGYDAILEIGGVRGTTNAFAANQTQFSIPTPDEIWPMLEQGVDAILVAPSTFTGYFLVSKSEIKSMADVAGKVCGVSSPTSQSYTIPKYVFAQAGLDTSKIQFIAIGGSGARSSALLSGKIDIAVISNDLALRTVEKSGGKLRLLASIADYAGGHSPDHADVWVHRDWAAKNPQAMMDYTRAVILSQVWMGLHEDEFVQSCTEKIDQKPGDPALLKFYHDLYWLCRSKGWNPYVALDTQSIELVLSWSKAVGNIKGTVPIKQVYEPKYLNEVTDNLLKYVPQG